MAVAERRLQITDVKTLAALAHPLRVALLDQLAALGPRTASQCAHSLGETPANCSYHLRQLERFGLVTRSEASNGRERPWEVLYTGLALGAEPDDRDADQAARAIQDTLTAIGIQQHTRLALQYLRLAHRAGKEWNDAAASHDYGLLMTAQELGDLVEVLDRAIRPFIRPTRQAPPPDARPVHLDLRAFLRPEELV
ncbi:MAG TPA: winged helix-turn-helix domain-containing protein [Actinomycetota bacterium]|nr:winged helix-turn-helix domain-containing protein [Actinomycetota bacterium]